jgi:hypothetical protein
MKKIYILAVALFASAVMIAQEAKELPAEIPDGPAIGSVYLSGLVNISSNVSKDDAGNKTYTSTNFGITPVGGYMLTDRIGVQGVLGYNSSVSDSDPGNDGGKSGTNTFNFGVGARYFMGAGKFYFSPSLNLVFGSSTNKSDDFDAASGNWDYEKSGSSFSTSIAVLPSVTYFFNNNWSGEFAVGRFGYSSEVFNDVDGDKTGSYNQFDFKVDLTNINIGVSYWFK